MGRKTQRKQYNQIVFHGNQFGRIKIKINSVQVIFFSCKNAAKALEMIQHAKKNRTIVSPVSWFFPGYDKNHVTEIKESTLLEININSCKFM